MLELLLRLCLFGSPLRYYADPVISLVITAIIFSSALPLVKSASLILLQGVPQGVSLEDVKEDILQVFANLNHTNPFADRRRR
jgi:Co/Zn/Cd efflux system component